MSRYRKTMKETLREVRGLIKEDTTTSYPPKEINKKKHDAYKDPKRGEHEILKKETSDPTVDDIAKGLKLDKKLVKKIMGEVFDYDEKVLDENVSQQIKTLKTIMAPMRGAKISIDGANKLMKIMDKFDKKEDLIALFKADIPFVSQSAAARLISKFRMSGAEVNKLREEVELKELFGISSTAYHRNNTMKFLDKMGIKHEPTGRNGLIIKGVPKDKQQGLLNKIRKEVGMYNIATKDETIKESKYQVNYAKNNKLYSQTFNAKNEDDAEEKAIKKFKITDDDIRSVVKEETLDEAVADLFVKKGDVNKIAVKIAKSAKGLGLKSGVMGNQVRVKGSQKNVNDFMRAVIGKSSLGGPSEVGAFNPQIDKMLNKQLKKETIKEDGHTDVASAVRSCKTITEDANEIMGKLNSMSPEDSLPSWWTNKLAVASNSMNKMRDYILNPIQENVIQEAPGDLEDMKKVVDELKKASQMHLGQSKRVQAHIGMMEKGE